MNQPWSPLWFLSLIILVPGVWWLRRKFQIACVFWGRKSSASLRVAAWTVVAWILISAAGFRVWVESGGNVLATMTGATVVFLVFGPINMWWGLASFAAAWRYWWNRREEARRGEVIACLLAGMGSGLVIDVVTQSVSLGVYTPNPLWLIIGGVVGLFLAWFLSLDPQCFNV